MSENDQIVALLTRIEENQHKALELHQRHLGLAQAHLDRSNQTIQESLELQRTAVARQSQVTKFVTPVVAVLLLLLGYLLVKWHVL